MPCGCQTMTTGAGANSSSPVDPPDAASMRGRTFLLIEAVARLVFDGVAEPSFDNIVWAVEMLHPEIAPIAQEDFRATLRRGLSEGRFGVCADECVGSEARYRVDGFMDRRQPTVNPPFKAYYVSLICDQLRSCEAMTPQARAERAARRAQLRAQEHARRTAAAQRAQSEEAATVDYVEVPCFGRVPMTSSLAQQHVVAIRATNERAWRRHVAAALLAEPGNPSARKRGQPYPLPGSLADMRARRREELKQRARKQRFEQHKRALLSRRA